MLSFRGAQSDFQVSLKPVVVLPFTWGRKQRPPGSTLVEPRLGVCASSCCLCCPHHWPSETLLWVRMCDVLLASGSLLTPPEGLSFNTSEFCQETRSIAERPSRMLSEAGGESYEALEGQVGWGVSHCGGGCRLWTWPQEEISGKFFSGEAPQSIKTFCCFREPTKHCLNADTGQIKGAPVQPGSQKSKSGTLEKNRISLTTDCGICT